MFGSSACIKVLSLGLGPFKDQTAEMVLFWSSFYTKGSGTVKVLNSGLGPFKDQSAEMVLFYTEVLFSLL